MLRGLSSTVLLGIANTWSAVQTYGANLLFSADNTFDIGASAGTRPRYIYAGSALVCRSSTVAALPAAATPGAGALAYVTDATAVVARGIVAGGGTNAVLVMSNGTNWLIVA